MTPSPYRGLALTLLGCALVTSARAADWPTFRHDNRRSAVTNGALPLPLTRQWTWTSPVPPQPAWTGPAKWDAYSGNRGLQSMRNFDPVFHVTAAGGQVFFGSSTDHAVHALDAATGKEQWVFFTGAPVRLPPTWVEGRLLAGSDDGHVYALDAASGREQWRYAPVPVDRRLFNNGNLISPVPCRSGVLVDSGTAYFACSLFPWQPSWLCAVDVETGNVEGSCHYRVELQNVTLQGALLASSSTIYAPQGRSAALSYNRGTGQTLGPVGEAGGVHCLLTEDEQFIGGPRHQRASSDVVQVTRAGTRGALLSFSDTNRLLVRADRAWLHRQGRLQCLNWHRHGELADRLQTLKKQKPAVPDAIRQTEQDLKQCVLWSVPQPVPLEYAWADGHLVVGFDGAVRILDAEAGTLLWEAEVRGKVFGLAVADQRLLVSTDRGEVIGFAR